MKDASSLFRMSTGEMVVKLIAMGFLCERGSYLRDPWNWCGLPEGYCRDVEMSMRCVEGVAVANARRRSLPMQRGD